MSHFKDHISRLRAGAYQARSLTQVSKWVEQNTKIRGKPYSYLNHEYQRFILDAAEPEWVVRKCSQVGITEMSLRYALALTGMIRGFVVAYTLPTSSFAKTVMKTRVNPIIQDSPFLQRMVTDIDNVDVKQLGDSFLYCRGCASSNAPISVPCDIRIHDELDFSDPIVVSQYQSRLTHSPYKFKGQLSTPTLPGKGIDYEFQRSRRHFNFVKCSCCNHLFIPEYYDHVRIPGFSGDLHEINKSNLHKHAYKDAFVECPKCGGKPNLGPQHRQWVRENSEENFVAFGVQVSPFDAPKLITPGFLVEASTQYSNVSDFYNFSLGKTFENKDSVLTEEELRACITSNFNLDSGCSYVMGIDQGNLCYVTVIAVHYTGAVRVVHTEEVPLVELRKRYSELRAQYYVRLTVMDAFPNAELVLTLQRVDHNLFGGVYVERRSTEIFSVVDREGDKDRGRQELRQVNISRSAAFDGLMGAIRAGAVSKRTDANDELWVKHLTSMKRIKDWNEKSQEIVYRWVKSSDGMDHLHHSLLYGWIASQILGVGTSMTGHLPLISKFKHEPQV